MKQISKLININWHKLPYAVYGMVYGMIISCRFHKHGVWWYRQGETPTTQATNDSVVYKMYKNI